MFSGQFLLHPDLLGPRLFGKCQTVRPLII
jgi:hypothetical protein